MDLAPKKVCFLKARYQVLYIRNPKYQLVWRCLIIVCYKKVNAFRRSNLKFKMCSMHRISKIIHIRVLHTQILDIRDFRTSSKTHLFSCVKLGFEFYAKNAVPYKCQKFKKSFLSASFRFILGGRPLNATPKKPHTFGLYSTSKQSPMKVGSKK